MLDDEQTSTEESTDQTKETTDETTSDATDKTVTLTDEQIASLVKDERLAKIIQSEADKRAATIEKRMRVEQSQRLAASKAQREQDELYALVDDADTETLGQRTLKSLQDKRTMETAAVQFSGALEGILKEHPEFRGLGQDRIDEVYQDVIDKQGNVVDFMIGLSKARESQAIEVSIATAQKAFAAELDAKLTEYGLSRREKEGGPDETVSGTSGNVATADEDALLENPNTPTKVLKEILAKRGIQT